MSLVKNHIYFEIKIHFLFIIFLILGDMIQSVGVVIASIIVFFQPTWILADPICTLLFATLVMFTTFPVVKDCVGVLMEGTPVGIVITEFEEALYQIEGVVEVHDLHVWSLSAGKPTMSAHILSSNPHDTLKKATRVCRKYGIFHSTLQVEDIKYKNKKGAIKCDHNLHN